jgi:hypothetical protein
MFLIAVKQREKKIMRTIFLVLAMASLMSSGSAAPLLNQSNMVPGLGIVENVRIVCEPNGNCYQRGRRPVARWVYGEDAFYGPYVGPGNYGRPGSHSGWGWWW